MSPEERHFLLYQLLRQGQGPQPQEDEEMKRRHFLQKLIEMMQRRHGQMGYVPPAGADRYSDTPGRGNMPPYQMPGTQNIPEFQHQNLQNPMQEHYTPMKWMKEWDV